MVTDPAPSEFHSGILPRGTRRRFLSSSCLDILSVFREGMDLHNGDRQTTDRLPVQHDTHCHTLCCVVHVFNVHDIWVRMYDIIVFRTTRVCNRAHVFSRRADEEESTCPHIIDVIYFKYNWGRGIMHYRSVCVSDIHSDQSAVKFCLCVFQAKWLEYNLYTLQGGKKKLSYEGFRIVEVLVVGTRLNYIFVYNNLWPTPHLTSICIAIIRQPQVQGLDVSYTRALALRRVRVV